MFYSFLRMAIFVAYGVVSRQWFGWEISDAKFWVMLGLLVLVQFFTIFETESKK